MTISYNRLGSNGRLGNQMFQYAGLRGIAFNRGFHWLVPPPDSPGDSNYGLFDCFRMSSVRAENIGRQEARTFLTGQFHFSQDFFDHCPDGVNLDDHFQSEKYFSNVRHIIRSDFAFKDEILVPCQAAIEELRDPIFIHVRRGDYLRRPHAHPACPIEYYAEALAHFPGDRPALVFSDDIEWCRRQELFRHERFIFSDSADRYPQLSDTVDGRQHALIPYRDLCMMTLCSGGIIANSSLSWWGAWLIDRPTLPIIAPKPWFGPSFRSRHMGDLLPGAWIEAAAGSEAP